MTIISQQQDVMIVRDRLIWVRVLGVVFTLIGLGRFVPIVPSIDASSGPAWLGAIFLILGPFTLIAAETTTITLDKVNQKILILKKSLIKKTAEERTLAGIKSVNMEQRLERSRSKRGSYFKSYLDVILSFEDGTRFPFKATSTHGGWGASHFREKRRRFAENLATFLGVPCVDTSPPPPPTATEVLSTMADTMRSEIRKAQKERLVNEMRGEIKEEIRKEMEMGQKK